MEKKIVLIGVGALGSHAALFLRNLGDLRVCDMDRIEPKNILSQFHSTMGKGRNKAFSLQQTFAGLFGVRVEANSNQLTSLNAEQVFRDADLIVDCTDNLAARQTIQQYASQAAIPCLHGAISADGTFARIVWTEHFVGDHEGLPGQATCEDGANLPFHGAVGAQIALTAQRYLRDQQKHSYQMTPNSLLRIS